MVEQINILDSKGVWSWSLLAPSILRGPESVLSQWETGNIILCVCIPSSFFKMTLSQERYTQHHQSVL